MSVSNDDAPTDLIDATKSQEISSGDERERKKKLKINDIRLKTAVSIKNARLMADDNQLEEAKDIIVKVQCLLYDEDFVELDTLKSDLQQLLMLMQTQETYEKQGRAFALPRETSHDSLDLAGRGNEGPSSGTGKTKLRIITKREAPLEENKFKVKLELSSNETTQGLDLVTVLDISGSMQGEKLEKMKSAMQLVIKKLSPIDRLSVVTFSSHSNTLCHLTRMTKDSKAEIGMEVNDLVADGTTNISAGLKKGLQELKDSSLRSKRWFAIMLLCDGEQTKGVGPRDPDAAEVEIGNVPVYTFGLGSYYDPKVLKAIANKSSGGMFTDVQNVDKLSEAFSQCLDGLRRLVFRDLKVTITQKKSTKMEVSAENYIQYKDEIGSIVVSFGDLYEEELRKVIVDLLLPDVSSTQCADILTISYMYRFCGELIKSEPLPVTITRRNSTPMINEARVVTDRQMNIANKMIFEAEELLKNVVDETLESEVQQLRRLMNSQKTYNDQESKVIIDEAAEETVTIWLKSGLKNYSTASPLGQASTVDSDNDVNKIPIEFLLDRTGVRKRIPQLLNRSNNYVDWSKKVKQDLQELNVWKVIEGEPSTETNESIENVYMGTAIQKLRQFRENWMALILIYQACGFPINLQIIDLDSARAAWETLVTNRKQVSGVENFFSAVECGDWKNAERFLDSNRELALVRIASSQNTVLHLASLAGEINIVKKLVQFMTEEDLEIKDKDGYTALAKASINGDKIIAQCMIQKNKRLVSIPAGTKLLPVVIAMMYGNKEMAMYLYSVTPQKDLANEDNKGNINGATLLTYSIRRQCYDISFDLIKKCSPLAVALDHNGQSALYQLASTPSAFLSGSKLKFWQKWMYNCVPVPKSNRRNTGSRGTKQPIVLGLCTVSGIKGIYEMKLVHRKSLRLLDIICQQIENDLDDDEINGIINALHEAATQGVVELIGCVLKRFPGFRWLCDKEGSNIFMKAVQFRQADVFSLIHGFPSRDKMVVLVDKRGENILHKLKHSSVDKISTIQGLIKMQTELKWFKEIKLMMPPDSLKKQNLEGKTAQELIAESHNQLRKNAEKGMKETVNSCIIVGILVVIIMFAAAFTVPGENNHETGHPIFIKKKLFKIFIISDAVSLLFSTTSVFMFLGILTSNFEEKDFLQSFPRNMINALFTLFISITAMMTAFAATFFLMVGPEFRISLPLMTCLLTFFPVIIFARSFFPLVYECAMSTYGRTIFNRKI